MRLPEMVRQQSHRLTLLHFFGIFVNMNSTAIAAGIAASVMRVATSTYNFVIIIIAIGRNKNA